MVLKSSPKSCYDRHFIMEDPDCSNNSPVQSDFTDSRMIVNQYRPTSALARGVQITEFAESRVNPTPLMMDESDILIEQYLSPGKLQMLTGVDDLQCVESLQLKVDSRETSLGNFGSLLPNLTELKLSGSCILSARDLGSSLHNLNVLWLSRCGLEELDGISSMLNLKELYLEYNEISDLSPLSMLEELQILDLEGNNIEDITQVQYLSFCPKLYKLALDGNPICVIPSPTHNEPDYNYRQAVQKFLPQLSVLDDEKIGEEDPSIIKHNVFDDDWAYLEELQKDVFLKEEFMKIDTVDNGAGGGDRSLSAALRPATVYRPGSALRPSSGFRPLSASRHPSSMSASNPSTASHPMSDSANRPVSSDAVERLEAASELTIGGVICGNPSKALRQRRSGGAGSEEEIQKGLSKLLQKGAVFHHCESAEDEPYRPEEEMNNIIEELQSWKVEHEMRMKEIQKTKEAQVLVIDHDEAGDVIGLADSESDDADDTATQKEEFDSRPLSANHRHKSNLRLRPKGDFYKDDKASGGDNLSNDVPTSYRIKMQSKYAVLRRSVGSFESQEKGDGAAAVASSEDTFDSRQPTVLSSLSNHQNPLSRSGSNKGDFASDAQISPHLKLHRHTDPDSLHLLRAPSPTSAQIINSMRSKKVQSPPSPKASRKLRVGPTGLPLSSQQPVIRNSITSMSSRPGPSLVPNPRNPSSRGNIALLPSQPRIPRHLPEPPRLFPHPPQN